MAKVGFSKLGLSINKEIKIINWNEQEIEVKQYLPSDDKLELCSKIINNSIDDYNFYNPGRVAIWQTIEVICAYTNINITDKQKEDPCKLFDLLHNGLLQEIYGAIPESEIGIITNIVEGAIENIYKYKNSVLGILDAMKNDYDGLNFDAQAIQKAIGNGENVEFLKEILTKLG